VLKVSKHIATQLHEMLNIGPVTAQMLIDVGITTPEQLTEIGAIDAWKRLRSAFGSQISVIGLYALYGALTQTHWNQLSAEEKLQLREAAKR
jgi:DNA transformation protein and related proteins